MADPAGDYHEYEGEYTIAPKLTGKHYVGIAFAMLVVAIIIFVATRDKPAPFELSSGTCMTSADCVPPKTCNVGSNYCVDLILPGLIEDAQTAVKDLYFISDTIGNNFKDFMTNPIYVQVVGKADGVDNPPISLGSIQVAVDEAYDAFVEFNDKQLVVPGCDPTGTKDCGYYNSVMKLTVNSEVGEIISVGGSAGAISVMMETVTNLLPAVRDAQTAVLNNASAAYASRGKYFSPHQVQITDTLSNEARNMDTYINQFMSGAERVSDTGKLLYTHYIKA